MKRNSNFLDFLLPAYHYKVVTYCGTTCTESTRTTEPLENQEQLLPQIRQERCIFPQRTNVKTQFLISQFLLETFQTNLPRGSIIKVIQHQLTLQESHGHVACIIQPQEIVIYLRIFLSEKRTANRRLPTLRKVYSGCTEGTSFICTLKPFAEGYST